MKITPLDNIIQLRIEKVEIGNLVTDSKESAVEYGEVIAIGKNVKDLKVGDCVFVKSWSLDLITHQSKKYYFCSTETNGILAIVK